jgi:O-antigen/teichoic acid export membrane protein
LIVGALLGAAPLAAYTICTQLAQQVHALPAAAMAFLFPMVSRRLGAGDAAGVLRARRASIGAALLIIAVLGALLAAGADPILRLWMGGAFADDYGRLFVWLVAAYALVALNVAPHFLLLGHGDARYLSLLGLAGGATSLLVMLYLIPAYGLLGAVAGKACYGVVLCYAYIRLSRIGKVRSP